MKVVAAVLAGLALAAWSTSSGGTSVGAASAPRAPAFAVALAAPSAGDVSYGVARVRIVRNKPLRLPAGVTRGLRVFAGEVGGLVAVVRSSSWRQLRATTRVYIVVSRVRGAPPAVRDVVFFIVRRKTTAKALDSPRGDLIVTIANAQAVPGSFWVRGLDVRGYANVFRVRNIIGTAVANWTRYLTVLKLARALDAAAHPLVLSPAPRAHGVHSAANRHLGPWTGGQHASGRVLAMYRLIFGAVGDPAKYAAAKRSPLVIDFIEHELRNPQLADRWRRVVAQLPLRVPDAYAAAAQEEARFVKVAKPRISSARVAIDDQDNSSWEAFLDAIGSAVAVDQHIMLTVIPTGSGAGTVSDVASGSGIDCPTACSVTFPQPGSVWIRATPAAGSAFSGWSVTGNGAAGAADTHCSTFFGSDQCFLSVYSNTVVRATFTSTTSYQLTVSSVNEGISGTGTVTSSPPGLDCGATCAANFAAGTSVMLTATPRSGSAFSGWKGCDTSTGDTCTVAMNSSRTVEADFGYPYDPPPAASFTVSPSDPQPPETPIHFDGSASSDPDGQIVDYKWDFGDGQTSDSGSSPTTVHSYFCYGTVTATLTVTDESGQTDHASGYITITPQQGWPHCP